MSLRAGRFFVVLPPYGAQCAHNGQRQQSEVYDTAIKPFSTFIIEAGSGFGTHGTTLCRCTLRYRH